MNKKGIIGPYLNAPFIIATIIAIIALLLLSSGGAKAIFSIGQFIAKIPALVWVVLIVIFLFRMVGGKRR